MKEFLKEGLFVALLVIVLSLAVDLLPLNISSTALFSPVLMLFGIIVLLLPVLPSAIAGYWIRKKTSKKDYFIVPAIGAMIGSGLLIVFSLVQLMLMNDAALLVEMQEVSSFGITFFEEMDITEFRSFLISTTAFGLVFVIIINGALGVVGGIIGGYIANKKK